MSPEQITLIRDTWRQGGPIADTAAALFYDRLFELDPDVRVLFRGTDMARQHTALVQAITAVVDGLDRFDKLVPNIEALGRRHNAYGVTDRHYDTVGKALLWTLEKGLGDAWTPEAADAWRDAYAAVAGIMRSAGRASAAPSPIRAA